MLAPGTLLRAGQSSPLAVTETPGRVRRIVLEPRVGGQHYEDWGDG
jgi:hypothetical protein